MRIGIDARIVSTQRGGVGAYTLNLLSGLCALREHDVVAFTPGRTTRERDLSASLPRLTWVVLDSASIFEVPTPMRRLEQWQQAILPRHLDDFGIDVFLGPANEVPLAWNGTRVVTVHDMIWKDPDLVDEAYSSYPAQWFETCTRASDAVISVSQTTTADMRYYWDSLPPISTIHLAPSLVFVPNDTAASRHAVREHLKLDRPYVLYVGGAHRRKNLVKLLEAFALTSHARNGYELVLAVDRSQRLDDEVDVRGINGLVRFIGYCPPVLLPHLYRASDLMVYPSLYEGFGLPPLEAMACGTPVACSETGSLPEILGDNVVYFDPRNAAGIAREIDALLQSPSKRQHLAVAGCDWASEYSWNETALRTMRVLEDAAQSLDTSGVECVTSGPGRASDSNQSNQPVPY